MERLNGLDTLDFLYEGTNNLKIALPKDVNDIYKLFSKKGKELYIVGGAVRDALMNKKPKDFDLATDAKAEEVIRILKSAGYKTLEVGAQFGVVVAITDETPDGIEIATFREDIGKGRRPDSVKFSTIEKDVKRRDLTMNALFYDIGKKKIVDLVGGVEDIKKGRIRTVGNAVDRFDEDPLRKLRALRFAGRTNSKLDKQIESSLLDDNTLNSVSPERIREEVKKGIESSKKPEYFLSLLDKFNFLQYVFPGLQVNKKWVKSNDWIIQLASLLQDNESGKIRNKLNKATYTSQEINNIIFLLFLKEFKQDIIAFKNLEKKLTLSSRQINEWIKINNLNKKLIQSAMKWNIKTKGNSPEITSLGLKGKEIGDKIKELEISKFLKSL